MKDAIENHPPVVVITGASAGVGRATAQAFARLGARIGLIARGREGLEGARADVERLGGQALVLPLDVAHADAVESAAAAVEEAFGPVDIWINNAMVSVFSPIKEMTAAEFARVTEVTYLGVVHGTISALRRMQPRDCGIIIQVGSALSYRAIPLQSAYCAAKYAVRGFTDSLRTELIHDRSNVRLTMVHLPAINTPQFDWAKSRLPRKAQPVPPIFQPEVAADAILWCASRNRRELFVGWPSVEAINGNKIMPGVLDHFLGNTAFDGQQTDEPKDPHQPDNLWEPVDVDRGAHGRFDDQARSLSLELWFAKRRVLIGGIGLGVLAAAAWLARRVARECS